MSKERGIAGKAAERELLHFLWMMERFINSCKHLFTNGNKNNHFKPLF